MNKYIFLFALVSICWTPVCIAGEADVVKASAARGGDNRYNFSVTVAHQDTGWDHYADKWDILGPDGTVLDTRILHHPHVNEQPFTRSLSGVAIPGHIKTVTVRAHDSVHGYGGKTVALKLP